MAILKKEAKKEITPKDLVLKTIELLEKWNNPRKLVLINELKSVLWEL